MIVMFKKRVLVVLMCGLLLFTSVPVYAQEAAVAEGAVVNLEPTEPPSEDNDATVNPVDVEQVQNESTNPDPETVVKTITESAEPVEEITTDPETVSNEKTEDANLIESQPVVEEVNTNIITKNPVEEIPVPAALNEQTGKLEKINYTLCQILCILQSDSRLGRLVTDPPVTIEELLNKVDEIKERVINKQHGNSPDKLILKINRLQNSLLIKDFGSAESCASIIKSDLQINKPVVSEVPTVPAPQPEITKTDLKESELIIQNILIARTKCNLYNILTMLNIDPSFKKEQMTDKTEEVKQMLIMQQYHPVIIGIVNDLINALASFNYERAATISTILETQVQAATMLQKKNQPKESDTEVVQIPESVSVEHEEITNPINQIIKDPVLPSIPGIQAPEEVFTKTDLKVSPGTLIVIELKPELTKLSNAVQGGGNITVDIFSDDILVGRIDNGIVTYAADFLPGNIYVVITGKLGAKFDVVFTFDAVEPEGIPVEVTEEVNTPEPEAIIPVTDIDFAENDTAAQE